MDARDRLEIERLGGLAGIGLPGSKIRSRAELTGADLTAAETKAVEELFAGHGQKSRAPTTIADAFRYRLTLRQGTGRREIEVAENEVPASLQGRVTDELL